MGYSDLAALIKQKITKVAPFVTTAQSNILQQLAYPVEAR